MAHKENLSHRLSYLKDVLGVKYIGHPPRKSAVAKPVKFSSLEGVRSEAEKCVKCKLCKGRTRVVFGSGNPRAKLMFVGEGPGEQEDLQGLPFVGAAGKLLTKMIEAMGLTRDAVYITNVVKCRPPSNRKPEPDEAQMCSPYLEAELDFVNPQIVVALGATAAENLLKTNEKIGKLRGRALDFRKNKLIATYHPAYLLRNPDAKKLVWEDLQLVMSELGLKKNMQKNKPDSSKN